MFTVDLDGRQLRVPTTAELTLDEWVQVKTTLAMNAVEFEAALRAIDPCAWKLLLEIGLGRDGGDLVDLGRLNLLGLIKALEADSREPTEAEAAELIAVAKGDAIPPAGTPSRPEPRHGGHGSGSGNGGSVSPSPPSLATIPAPSGPSG